MANKDKADSGSTADEVKDDAAPMTDEVDSWRWPARRPSNKLQARQNKAKRRLPFDDAGGTGQSEAREEARSRPRADTSPRPAICARKARTSASSLFLPRAHETQDYNGSAAGTERARAAQEVCRPVDGTLAQQGSQDPIWGLAAGGCHRKLRRRDRPSRTD